MSTIDSKNAASIASIALPAYVAYRAVTAKNNRIAKLIASIPCCQAIRKMEPIMEKTPSTIPAVAISSIFTASVISNQNNLAEIAGAGLIAPTLVTGGSILANRVIEAAREETPNSLLDSILAILSDVPSSLRNLFSFRTEGPLAYIKHLLKTKV